MDFSSLDVHEFLKASMPVRFADISPYDFEDFIAELFSRDGYEVDATPYSGDFGADLQIAKEGVKTVVQVKRYGEQTSVGVSDINQAIGARTYYEADEALVITTSAFTQSAIVLAKSAPVILWDWERLQRYISEVCLDGEDYYAFFGDDLTASGMEDDAFRLHFHKLDLEEDHNGHPAISTFIGIENQSGQNAYVHLELPIVVDKSNRQVAAIAWRENYFHDGLLISGARTEASCYFLKDQIPEIKPGDRMILRMHIRGHEQPVIIDQKIGIPRSGCYIVTYCYGKDSEEYKDMISLRNSLGRHLLGSAIVRQYYRTSPSIVWYLATGGRVAIVIHLLLRRGIEILLFLWRSIRNNDAQCADRHGPSVVNGTRLLNNTD